MLRAFGVLVAAAASAAAYDFCPLPHYARGGKLVERVCGPDNSTRFGADARTKTTPLDHADPQAGTFSQRWWLDTTSSGANKSAPIIFYFGGEGPAGPAGGWAASLADTFKAVLVTLEHRFYGHSMPSYGDPATALSKANLKYLTVDAALQDVNALQDVLRGDGYNGQIINIGGSYPGALVAWHRVKYPARSVASLASSGVVNAILEYVEFDEAIAAATEGTCADLLRATSAAFDAASAAGGQEAIEARRLFKSAPDAMPNSDFAYMLADAAAMMVQYGSKKELCSSLQAGDPAALRSNFADIVLTHYGDDFAGNCFYSTDCLQNDPANWIPTSRSWRWQKCTEVAWLQSAPAASPIRSSSYLTLADLQAQCTAVFGETPDVPAFNAQFGGAIPPAKWVFYSQGSDDPWRPAGVMAPLGPDRPEYTAFCDGCGHCGDLHTPRESDPAAVQHQRQLEAAFLVDAMRAS